MAIRAVRPPKPAESDGIVIEHLRVVRGGRIVLDDFGLSVPPGQVVGLLGPSGSGKSTLMRAIVGVQVVDAGSVTVLGQPAGSPSLRDRVAYLTQEVSIYDDLRVAENVRYFARALGAPDDDPARVLRLVDLDDHRDALTRNLSGGQRSRVSLACALVGDPRVVVLDEPTVGLDPVLRRDLWRLFGMLAEQGRCVFVSTHVADEARRCGRLVLLYRGRILADTTPSALMSATRTTDADSAFLALIDAARDRHPGPLDEDGEAASAPPSPPSPGSRVSP